MIYRKITTGCVAQEFNDVGECLGQVFLAGDIVEYETKNGIPINQDDMPLTSREYHPFDMVQPNVSPSDDVLIPILPTPKWEALKERIEKLESFLGKLKVWTIDEKH